MALRDLAARVLVARRIVTFDSDSDSDGDGERCHDARRGVGCLVFFGCGCAVDRADDVTKPGLGPATPTGRSRRPGRLARLAGAEPAARGIPLAGMARVRRTRPRAPRN